MQGVVVVKDQKLESVAVTLQAALILAPPLFERVLPVSAVRGSVPTSCLLLTCCLEDSPCL